MLESRLLAAESRVSHLELEKSSAVFSLERRMSTENTKLQVCRRLCGVSHASFHDHSNAHHFICM